MVENNFKKRNSIFSNGSINGFNSILYLPSEFNADSDSEAWIPINEASEANISKIQKSAFIDDRENDNLDRLLNTGGNNSIQIKPLKKINQRSRRLSTPVALPDDLHKQLSTNFYERNKKKLRSTKHKPSLDVVEDFHEEESFDQSDSSYLEINEIERCLKSTNILNSNSNMNNFTENSSIMNPIQNNSSQQCHRMPSIATNITSSTANNTITNSVFTGNTSESISNASYMNNYQSYNTGNLMPTTIPANQNHNLLTPMRTNSSLQYAPIFQQPVTMNTMVYHHNLMLKEKQISKAYKHEHNNSNSSSVKSINSPIKKSSLAMSQNSFSSFNPMNLGSSTKTEHLIKSDKKDKNKDKKKKQIQREGDWICPECQNMNFSFRVTCNKCPYEKGKSQMMQVQMED